MLVERFLLVEQKINHLILNILQKGWRLRHTCVEGPESAVYIRGKLEGDHIIKLPRILERFDKL